MLLVALTLFACDPPSDPPCAHTGPSDTYHAFHEVASDGDDYGQGVLHDSDRNVTCWYVQRNARGTNPSVSLSCIPDWQLQKPGAE